VNEPGGRSSLYSTFSAHAGISLAAVIHSLGCPFSSSNPSFLSASCMRVIWSDEVSLLVVALDTMRRAFASEILTPSLRCFGSHRHLHISIIESIVGEFAAVLRRGFKNFRLVPARLCSVATRSSAASGCYKQVVNERLKSQQTNTYVHKRSVHTANTVDQYRLALYKC
jgi:hypothetical protein